ncbi:hypothetical protein GCM10017788_28440 [Amycolatopsis acidiphila]|nr:hypothetical protein GCM10017788_28440 [Amycolatopsis acidiphila]
MADCAPDGGLIPDMTGTQVLPELVGRGEGADVHRPRRRGVEAVRLGLTTRVGEDPLASALELAAEIAARCHVGSSPSRRARSPRPPAKSSSLVFARL